MTGFELPLPEIEVYLSDRDIAGALEHAQQIHQQNVTLRKRRGSQGAGKTTEQNQLDIDFRGTCAQWAFDHLCYLPHETFRTTPDPGTSAKKSDARLGKYEIEVRSTWDGLSLIVRKPETDPPGRLYVLVYAHRENPKRFTISRWMWGYHAQQKTYWRLGAPGREHDGAAFFVEPYALPEETSCMYLFPPFLDELVNWPHGFSYKSALAERKRIATEQEKNKNGKKPPTEQLPFRG